MGLEPTILTWNALISSFQQSCLSYEALEVFRKLQYDMCFRVSRRSAQINSPTVVSALVACADLNSWCQGKEIHGYTLTNGFESNIHVSNALVDMYMKSKDMQLTTKIFGRTIDKHFLGII